MPKAIEIWRKGTMNWLIFMFCLSVIGLVIYEIADDKVGDRFSNKGRRLRILCGPMTWAAAGLVF